MHTPEDTKAEEKSVLSKIVIPKNETEFGGRPMLEPPVDDGGRHKPKDLPEDVYFTATVERLQDDNRRVRAPNFSCKLYAKKGVSTDDDSEIITKALATNCHARKLILNSNNLTSACMPPLANTLKVNDVLTELWLNHNAIDDDGVDMLVKAILKNKPDKKSGSGGTALTKLCLNHNRIGSFGAWKLSALCRGESKVKVLFLSHNHIHSAGARSLARAIQSDEGSLTELYLGGNKIGDKGAKCFASALKNNSRLRKLSLAEARIGDAGAELLSDALRHHNAALRVLWLHGNNPGMDEVERQRVTDALQTRPRDEEEVGIYEEIVSESESGSESDEEGAKVIPVKCAQVTLTLHGDLSHFIDGSDHRRDFEAGLRAEVAEVLGISPERVRLVSLKAGSIIATLQIDEDKALSESDLDDLVDLLLQLHSQGALAGTGKVLRKLDQTIDPVVKRAAEMALAGASRKHHVPHAGKGVGRGHLKGAGPGGTEILNDYRALPAAAQQDLQSVVNQMVFCVEYADVAGVDMPVLLEVRECLTAAIGQIELDEDVHAVLEGLIFDIEVSAQADAILVKIAREEEAEREKVRALADARRVREERRERLRELGLDEEEIDEAERAEREEREEREGGAGGAGAAGLSEAERLHALEMGVGERLGLDPSVDPTADPTADPSAASATKAAVARQEMGGGAADAGDEASRRAARRARRRAKRERKGRYEGTYAHHDYAAGEVSGREHALALTGRLYDGKGFADPAVLNALIGGELEERRVELSVDRILEGLPYAVTRLEVEEAEQFHTQKAPLRRFKVVEQVELTPDEWHRKRLEFVQAELKVIVGRETKKRAVRLRRRARKAEEERRAREREAALDSGVAGRLVAGALAPAKRFLGRRWPRDELAPASGPYAELALAVKVEEDALWQKSVVEAARKEALRKFCAQYKYPIVRVKASLRPGNREERQERKKAKALARSQSAWEMGMAGMGGEKKKKKSKKQKKFEKEFKEEITKAGSTYVTPEEEARQRDAAKAKKVEDAKKEKRKQVELEKTRKRQEAGAAAGKAAAAAVPAAAVAAAAAEGAEKAAAALQQKESAAAKEKKKRKFNMFGSKNKKKGGGDSVDEGAEFVAVPEDDDGGGDGSSSNSSALVAAGGGAEAAKALKSGGGQEVGPPLSPEFVALCGGGGGGGASAEVTAAARTIQSLYRTREARRMVQRLLAEVFEKVYDESSGYYYYQNKKTGETSWEAPKLAAKLHTEIPDSSYG